VNRSAGRLAMDRDAPGGCLVKHLTDGVGVDAHGGGGSDGMAQVTVYTQPG
jgi:hypothetical protein